MVNDIIADGLTRIRNAGMRRLEITRLIYSKLMVSVLEVFKEKGYIEDFKVVKSNSNEHKKSINVVLKYGENGLPAFTEITKVSKCGRRVYKGTEEIKRFKNGYGTIVVSTSQGVLSNDKAYKLRVGGEVLCTIW